MSEIIINEHIESCIKCCFCKILSKGQLIESQNICANCHSKEALEDVLKKIRTSKQGSKDGS